MNYAEAKHLVFGSRITVHPSIANAYCVLTLSHAIMHAIENGKPIATANSVESSNAVGEQALMKALFLELMNRETQDIGVYLSKYSKLDFVQTLIKRADFQAIHVETTSQDEKQKHYAELAGWLVQNLNRMGLRYTSVPATATGTQPMLVQNSHALGLLKTGMDALLKTGPDRSLLNSPSRFWVGLELIVGLFMVAMTLSAAPYIMQGKAILLLLAGVYGAYLTHKSVSDILVPAFEPNLSSMPKSSDKETIVINQDTINVVAKSKANSSYGTFWKLPEEPKSESLLDKAKARFHQMMA